MSISSGLPPDEIRTHLVAAARALQGSSVTEVRYMEPATSDRGTAGYPSRFDQAGMGIEFGLSDDRIWSAAWEMNGYCEGLTFGVVPSSEFVRSDRVRAITVSGTDDWKWRLGKTIGNVGLAWQVSDDRCPETVWSIRIELGDSVVVIALGEEKEQGRIGYQPDNLVVMFDPALANSYDIPASNQTAWGSSV